LSPRDIPAASGITLRHQSNLELGVESDLREHARSAHTRMHREHAVGITGKNFNGAHGRMFDECETRDGGCSTRHRYRKNPSVRGALDVSDTRASKRKRRKVDQGVFRSQLDAN
jgi:hypothetical protein